MDATQDEDMPRRAESVKGLKLVRMVKQATKQVGLSSTTA
jgi:hypothetical protein